MPPQATDLFGYRRLAEAIEELSAKLDSGLTTVNKPAWLKSTAVKSPAMPKAAEDVTVIVNVGGTELDAQVYALLVQIAAELQQISGPSGSATLVNQQAILFDLSAITAQIAALARPPPTRIAVELPSIMRKGTGKMANFEINDDWVVTATIKTTNAAGVTEPAPAGDVFTVTSSSPSLGVSIGTDASGAPAVMMTPTVQASPNITVTVSDSSGLAAFSFIVDIVPDTTPTNVLVDLADATHTSQAPPAATGP